MINGECCAHPLSHTFSLVVMMGRYLFTFYVAKNHSVHDLYSFLLGLHVLLALGFAADFMVRNVLALQADRWNMSWSRAYAKLKHACLRITGTAYILLAFGLIMPMLVGLFVELYFILPTRRSSRHDIATNLLQVIILLINSKVML
jgi:hypothetical protein